LCPFTPFLFPSPPSPPALPSFPTRRSSDLIVVGIQFTRERKTVRCNRRFEEMFGYAPGAAVGAPTRDVYFTDAEYEEMARNYARSEEHTSELQSRVDIVCRLLPEKNKSL